MPKMCVQSVCVLCVCVLNVCFRLFIINQYCTPNGCYTTKNVFKASARLVLSLLCYLFTSKNACSKQAEGWFLFLDKR